MNSESNKCCGCNTKVVYGLTILGAFLIVGALVLAMRHYTQTAPLKIYQGDADQLVLETSTRAMVDALRAGGNTVDYEVVAGGTHTNIAFGFVAYQELRTSESIQWLREKLDAP